MRVVDNVPLASLTTLRIGGPAAHLVVASSEHEIIDVVREIDARGRRLLVIGGGSNLVIADEGFDGTVVRVDSRGRTAERGADGHVLVTVAAGEPWDDFVAWAVGEGLSGTECLAGIPGLVGAVPMQNVGAYGADVAQTIVRLRAYDRELRRVIEVDRDACEFAYRTSAFRGKDRHVILDVTFSLERTTVSRPLRYAELARALGIGVGERAPLAIVRSTVIELRRKKGMVLDSSDPDTTSAGSFFTNPILDADALRVLERRADGQGPIPIFPESDGRAKVSAAWLIEHAGFAKGRLDRSGRVAVSMKHALALTNRGGATTAELVAFAREIRDAVRARFGVLLENEPVFVGVRL